MGALRLAPRGATVLRGLVAACAAASLALGLPQQELGTIPARLERAKQLAREGQLTLARDEFESVRRDCEALGPLARPAFADALSGSGAILLEMRDPGTALPRLLLAHALLDEQRDDPRGIAQIEGNIGIAYAESGSIEEGLCFMEQALARLESLLAHEDRQLETALLNYAVSLRSMGRLADSRVALERLIDRLLGRSPDPETTKRRLTAQFNLAVVLGLEGRLEEARALHLRVLEERYVAFGDERNAHVLLSLEVVVRTLLVSGRGTEIRPYFEALWEGTRMRLEDACRTGYLERANAARNASRTLAFGWLCVGADPRNAPLYDAAMFTLVQQRRALVHEPLPGSGSRAALQEAQSDVSSSASGGASSGTLEAAVVRREAAEYDFRSGRRDSRSAVADAPTPARVGAWLAARGGDARSAALDFVVIRTSDLGADIDLRSGIVLAYAVTFDAGLHGVIVGEVSDVEAELTRWRDAVLRVPQDEASAMRERAAGEALRATLLDPLLARVGEVSRLHVCADDFLALLPFDALPLEDGVVGDRYSVRFHSAISDLACGSPRLSGTRDLVVVDSPDYDAGVSAPDGVIGSFAKVFGSTELADRLCARFQARFGRDPLRISGSLATDLRARELAPRARYLHLDTHGWIAESPFDRAAARAPLSRCGLAMAGSNATADAALTAEELAGFELEGCALVVFNACNSRVGLAQAGAGLASLQAAARFAGARATLATVWDVYPDAGHSILGSFYERLWSDARPSPARALWDAKLALRRARFPTAAWAGWIVSGCQD